MSFGGKAPNVEELYSAGPHRATGLFEVGDPTLSQERYHSFEAGFLYRKAALRLQLNAYRATFRNFTYQSITGLEQNSFPEAQFLQPRAHFWGGEFLLHWDALHRDEKHLEVNLGFDAPAASTAHSGRLPRIPPPRGITEINVILPGWRAMIQVERTFAATRIAPEESRTPGFTLVNFSLGTRLIRDTVVHAFALKGTNLMDATALNHASFFKEKVPFAGRSFSLSYQLFF